MRLPHHLFLRTRDAFQQHPVWHLARLRERWLPAVHRPLWQRARDTFPALRYLDQPGAGEEYLRYHRALIRAFEWLADANPAAGVVYAPWPRLPEWLTRSFSRDDGHGPGFLEGADDRIRQLVEEGTADQLGQFLEPTEVARAPFDGLAGAAYHLLARVESLTLDPTLVAGAELSAMSMAPNNAAFWGLHGWLDEHYAAWQRRHGEVVDQSLLAPEHGLPSPTAIALEPLSRTELATIDQLLARQLAERIRARPR